MLGTVPQRSFRQRLVTWRARLSIPSLLSGSDERRVVSLIAAVNGGVAIFVISVLAWVVDLPFLFPALGPTAFLLFSSPFSPASAPRAVIVGHFSSMVAGFTVWQLITLVCGQPVTPEVGGWPVLASASLALGATCVLLVRLSCPHAPACATGLIIALGVANDWSALLGMAAGVVLLTAQAIVINRIAGVAVPTWSPRSEDARHG